MSIRVRVKEDVTIMDLENRWFLIGVGDAALRFEVLEALDRGARKILVNLEKVVLMDASGRNALVRIKAMATDRNAVIKLVYVSDEYVNLLTDSFEIFYAEFEALESFDS